MMPGMRGMNPKQMEQMMKKMGMKDIKAEKVIIRMKDEKIIIKNPSVQVIDMQGQRTYTISGLDKRVRARSKKDGRGEGVDAEVEAGEEETVEEVTEKEDPEEVPPKYTDEDVRLVAEQANVSEEDARKALDECDGAPAEAIIKLMGG